MAETLESRKYHFLLRVKGIRTLLARRNTEHGSGLRVFRRVAERAIAWLHGFHKLRLWIEKTEHMQDTFLNLAHSFILACVVKRHLLLVFRMQPQ
jgi:hypothetical protein